MSQTGGEERENVRKRGGGERRGEERSRLVLPPLPAAIYSLLLPPAAFNGQIRDKRTRVESVYREKKGDPSVHKWDLCRALWRREEGKDRNTQRETREENTEITSMACLDSLHYCYHIDLLYQIQMLAREQHLPKFILKKKKKEKNKTLIWGQMWRWDENFCETLFSFCVEIFQPSMIKKERISCPFICKWASITDSSLKGVNAARCG